MRRIFCFLIIIFNLTGIFLGSGTMVYAQAPDNNPDDPISAGEEIKLFLPMIVRSNGESTSLVSIGPDWQLPNKDSSSAAISTDGRYVAFASDATNLLPGDTNGKRDIFVVDRTQNSIVRASVSTGGAEANGSCDEPSISSDGRFVAFSSSATNLVSGDANARRDVFLRDLQTNQTSLVSVSTGGVQADENIYNPQISANGNYIVYETSASNLVADDTNSTTDIFLFDRQLAQTTRVSLAYNGAQGNDSSSYPFISDDGRYVAFQSGSSNLVENDTNNQGDIFVRDLQAGQIWLVSVADNETQSNGGSFYASLSADGRYVAFTSDASNLASGDTNTYYDIYVRDRQAGSTQRVSVSSAGVQANEASGGARMASGGRYVVFESSATNLVPGDGNAKDDVFLRDLQTGTTSRLSVTSAGAEANNNSWYAAISADGARIAFQSTANNLTVGDTAIPDGVFITGVDIFLRDINSGQTNVVSRLYAPMQSNATSMNPVVSDDGRYVAFESKSTSLVPGDGMGSYKKVFVRDMLTKQSVIASISSVGVLSTGDSTDPSISGDGQVVSFTSYSSALVNGDTNSVQDVFVRNLAMGTTVRVSVTTGGLQGNDTSMQSRLSRNGGFVCFSSYATNLVNGDTNAAMDVFVRDLSNGLTERVSISSSGDQGNNYSWGCAISADGRYVAFHSGASNLVNGDSNAKQDIFVRDRQTGQTTLVSPGLGGAQSNGDSYLPSISNDGRYVAFESDSSNLVDGDTNACKDVFVFDRNTGSMLRASLSSTSEQADGASFNATISGNGQYIVFESIARNLITGDTNNNNDIYMRNLITGKTIRASVTVTGDQGNNASNAPRISANGKFVVFQSAASNLVAGDTNNYTDIFLRDNGFAY